MPPPLQIGLSEDQKKPSPKMEHFFSPNSGEDQKKGGASSNYWGDADVDHIQTIGGDTAKLLGGYIPPSPPGFGTPAHYHICYNRRIERKTRQNSVVWLANRHCLSSFLFKNRNIYATLNASNLNLTEERDSRR